MSSSRLIRASDAIGLPVVSIDRGEDIAEIKDVVYHGHTHTLIGFTLNKRGWLSGSLKSLLTADVVDAIGPDAVMVESQDTLVDTEEGPDDLVDTSTAHPVLATRVVSADGNELGEVIGVIIETGDSPAAVGYEVENSDATVFVPISAQMALSDDNLILPSEATEFVRNDMAGFGAAVDSFRSQLSLKEQR